MIKKKLFLVVKFQNGCRLDVFKEDLFCDGTFLKTTYEVKEYRHGDLYNSFHASNLAFLGYDIGLFVSMNCTYGPNL